jgi:hypothetical protein
MSTKEGGGWVDQLVGVRGDGARENPASWRRVALMGYNKVSAPDRKYVRIDNQTYSVEIMSQDKSNKVLWRWWRMVE